VQAVPDLTSSASIIYRHNISEDLAFTGRIENNFVGSRTDTTFYVNNLPSYDLTNLRAGLASDRWSALLFAKNVFNKRALLSDTLQIGVNVPTYNRISVGQPLTFGVDFSYRFKL
jgi:outer membrane receptor protein involved in Fe transport